MTVIAQLRYQYRCKGAGTTCIPDEGFVGTFVLADPAASDGDGVERTRTHKGTCVSRTNQGHKPRPGVD